MKVDLAPGGLPPEQVGDLARAAEAVGFDGLWLAETTHDPFLGAALALDATQHLRVGTAVAIAFARSPVSIAQTAFDLARLGHGRFELGLGTQVRGHVQRRFGMAWSAPAPRLGEWIGAIRAAWSSWQEGAPFRFRSEHLDLSLMSPFFSPPPLTFAAAPGTAPLRISVAGVGPALARLAGRLANGFHVHPLHTARYLAEVLEPALQQGEAERREAGRLERYVPVFLIPDDDPEVRDAVRRQISFYAATPTYRRVLELHGRMRTGERLSRLAAAGRWAEMPDLVDDELLGAVAVIAPWDGLADALGARCARAAHRVMPLLPFSLAADGAPRDAKRWERLVRALRTA